MSELDPIRSAQGEYLRRRNALWQALRRLEPGDASFEAALSALVAHTGMDRAQVLLGLGLDPSGSGPDSGSGSPGA